MENEDFRFMFDHGRDDHHELVVIASEDEDIYFAFDHGQEDYHNLAVAYDHGCNQCHDQAMIVTDVWRPVSWPGCSRL